MSQLPSGGYAPGANPLNSGAAVPRVISQELGIIPNIATPPPDTRGADTAGDFMRAFGLAGELAQTVRREMRFSAQEQKAIDVQLQGMGVERARVEGPELEQAIDRGDLRADDGEAVSDAAVRLARARTGEMNAATADGYVRAMAPRLAEAMTRRNQTSINAAFADAMASAAASASVATSPEEIRAIVASTMAGNPKLSETQALVEIVVPNLRAAAMAGDRARFDAAVRVLGERFPDVQAQARAQLAGAARDAEAFAVLQMEDDLAGHEIKGSPSELMRAVALGYRGRGVPDRRVAEAVRSIDAREKGKLAEAAHLLSMVEKDQIEQSIIQDAIQAGDRGLLSAVQDREELTSGLERVKVSRQEQIDRATMVRFHQIRQAIIPDGTPMTEELVGSVLTAQVKWASDNGIAPTPWARIMRAGALASSEQALLDVGKDQPPPQTALEGFDIFKRLSAMAPAMLDEMLAGHDQVREFYQRAQTIEEMGRGSGTPVQTLLAARRQMDTRAKSPMSSIRDKELSDATATITSGYFSDAANPVQVAGTIFRRAQSLVDSGLDPVRAVDDVAKSMKRSMVEINGWSVDPAGSGVPVQLRSRLSELAVRIADEYVTKHGAANGITAKSLTLLPHRESGLWMLSHAGGLTAGLPVDPHGEPSLVAFSLGDLTRLAESIDVQTKAAADKDIIERQNRGRQNPMVPQQRRGESDTDYLKRLGRKRPGEM